MVSPAPCVPNASIIRLCFLKMPASSPSVGAWFSQLLIWPIAIFSVSCADAARRQARARPARQPIRNVSSLPPFGFLLRRHLTLLCRAFAGTGCRAAASTARSIGPDSPRPSRSASRRTQYSQARAIGPGARLSCAGHLDLAAVQRRSRARASAPRTDTRRCGRNRSCGTRAPQHRRRPRSRRGGSSARSRACRARARAKRPPPASPPAGWCRRIRRC